MQDRNPSTYKANKKVSFESCESYPSKRLWKVRFYYPFAKYSAQLTTTLTQKISTLRESIKSTCRNLATAVQYSIWHLTAPSSVKANTKELRDYIARNPLYSRWLADAQAVKKKIQAQTKKSNPKQDSDSSHSVWDMFIFNLKSIYNGGQLPRKLAVYMLYILMGYTTVFVMPFNALLVAESQALSGAVALTQNVIRPFLLYSAVFITTNLFARNIYPLIVKVLSTLMTNDHSSRLRSIISDLNFMTGSKQLNDKDIKSLKEHTDRNLSSGSTAFYQKWNYFVESMLRSVINIIVIAKTLALQSASSNLFILNIVVILGIVNYSAVKMVNYFLNEITRRANAQKGVLQSISSRILSERSTTRSGCRRRHAYANDSMNENEIRKNLYDLVRSFITPQYSTPLITFALVWSLATGTAGITISFVTILQIAYLFSDLLENGIPFLSQGKTLQEASSAYENVYKGFNVFVNKNLIPVQSKIPFTSYFLVDLKQRSTQSILEDAVHTLYVASNVAFLTFMFYQHMAMLGVLPVPYVLASLMPATMHSLIFSHIPQAYLFSCLHAGAITGFFLASSAIRSLLTPSPDNSMVKFTQGLRTFFSAPLYNNGKTTQLDSKTTQLARFFKYTLATATKPFIRPVSFLATQAGRGENLYNSVFSVVYSFSLLWLIPSLCGLPTFPILSPTFLAAFLALSVTLSLVANLLLTPRYSAKEAFISKFVEETKGLNGGGLVAPSKDIYRNLGIDGLQDDDLQEGSAYWKNITEVYERDIKRILNNPEVNVALHYLRKLTKVQAIFRGNKELFIQALRRSFVRTETHSERRERKARTLQRSARAYILRSHYKTLLLTQRCLNDLRESGAANQVIAAQAQIDEAARTILKGMREITRRNRFRAVVNQAVRRYADYIEQLQQFVTELNKPHKATRIQRCYRDYRTRSTQLQAATTIQTLAHSRRELFIQALSVSSMPPPLV